MGVASLVLGIVGLLCSFIPCVGWMGGAPLGLLALIFGIVAIKKKKGKGLGIAGLVTGAIALLISAWWIYATAAAANELSEYEARSKELDKAWAEWAARNS